MVPYKQDFGEVELEIKPGFGWGAGVNIGAGINLLLAALGAKKAGGSGAVAPGAPSVIETVA